MSKLIGFIVIIIVAIVIIYSMYEMHRIQDISALQYLICGVLAILASYIGFYINMVLFIVIMTFIYEIDIRDIIKEPALAK